ncbi:hypothetical protein [Nostoc sp. TCL26-01]|uniref:hypothetical protein n=1 Tax=Nostoc sp. TCL26-01 TaxID=2576904 RepID=UPI0015BA9E84|nr:hypothetical protein [Nostoc sp. TCL26-01]QLE58122.1 hypothetical protein FD725_22965 [Nostoc sp. TCL26-01]
MRNDLQDLDISHNELQKLTNLPVKSELIIISNNFKKFCQKIVRKIKGSEGATVVFLSFSVLIFAYIFFDVIIKSFATWIIIPSWLLLIIFSFLGGLSTQISLYYLWKNQQKVLKKNMTTSLEILLNDVDRYNAVIKAIDINDQIEDAGNTGVSIQEREKIIAALKLTRVDLVRALKTEKILRENKNFILRNTDLFDDNLATLAAMQITAQATEHGRLLNEALQISLDVQYEMKTLQSQSNT